MRRLSLAALLGLLVVGVVSAAVIAVGLGSVRILRKLADEDARARVALGASGAAEAVTKSGADLAATGNLLAERPTLARLLEARDAAALREFLDHFAGTSRLTACVVRAQGAPVAAGGAALPWEKLLSGAGDSPGVVPQDGDAPLLLARAGVPALAGCDVVVAERLDAAFERRVSEAVGLPITLFRADAPGAPPHLASLRDDALEARHTVADLVDTLGVYVAVTPLPFAAAATGLGLQAMLPRETASAPVGRLTRELGTWAIVVVALAGLVALLVARRAGRPLRPLIAATTRFGRGDFSSPVPRAGLLQIQALAAAMEDMRVRLLRLTAELQRRQADAEAVLSGISEGVFTVDVDRRIRYVNPQAAALLGVSEHEAVGRFCGDVLNPQGPHGQRPCEEDCPIVHARFRGGARAAEHLSLPGGRLRTVVINSAPPSAEGDAAEGAGPLQFQLVRDETDLEATRRLRDTLVANISHEFRTPLSAQLASIEMLRERAGDLTSVEAQNLLQAIERGSLRLTRLIDNLLESLRIEAGEDSVRRAPVALDQVVEEAVESTGPLLEQRDQKLTVDLPYPLPTILGDATRLTQALVNLLANANKFAPAGSAVRVGGAVREKEVELWVEDEGPGLPEGGDRSIFERFVRAPGDEPEESGVGLGLWIVKSIAERHGGRVEARNLAPGTRVSVVVPRG